MALMLNLSYIEDGKLRIPKRGQTHKQPTTTTTITKKGKTIIYAACYDVLDQILKMQQEQLKFQKDNEGKRHNHIALECKHRTDISIKSFQGKYYIRELIVTPRQIWNKLHDTMSYARVANVLALLRSLEMIKVIPLTKSYEITAKGLEFIVVYEQLLKIFPYTSYDDIYKGFSHNNLHKQKQ